MAEVGSFRNAYIHDADDLKGLAAVLALGACVSLLWS
jgi:hypothetical protein